MAKAKSKDKNKKPASPKKNRGNKTKQKVDDSPEKKEMTPEELEAKAQANRDARDRRDIVLQIEVRIPDSVQREAQDRINTPREPDGSDFFVGVEGLILGTFGEETSVKWLNPAPDAQSQEGEPCQFCTQLTRGMKDGDGNRLWVCDSAPCRESLAVVMRRKAKLQGEFEKVFDKMNLARQHHMKNVLEETFSTYRMLMKFRGTTEELSDKIRIPNPRW